MTANDTNTDRTDIESIRRYQLLGAAFGLTLVVGIVIGYGACALL